MYAGASFMDMPACCSKIPSTGILHSTILKTIGSVLNSCVQTLSMSAIPWSGSGSHSAEAPRLTDPGSSAEDPVVHAATPRWPGLSGYQTRSTNSQLQTETKVSDATDKTEGKTNTDGSHSAELSVRAYPTDSKERERNARNARKAAGIEEKPRKKKRFDIEDHYDDSGDDLSF